MIDLATQTPPRRDADVRYALASMRNYLAMATHAGAHEDEIYQAVVDQLWKLQHPDHEEDADAPDQDEA